MITGKERWISAVEIMAMSGFPVNQDLLQQHAFQIEELELFFYLKVTWDPHRSNISLNCYF